MLQPPAMDTTHASPTRYSNLYAFTVGPYTVLVHRKANALQSGLQAQRDPTQKLATTTFLCVARRQLRANGK